MTAKTIWRVDTGASGYKPGRVLVEAATTDTYTIVTTAGYITAEEQQVWNLQKSDLVEVFYNNTSIGQFQPSISSGVVTLNSLSGTISGPTTTGDFAVFSDTVGGLKDAGYLPSDAAKTVVAMASGTQVANHIPVFADITGTIKSSNSVTAISGSHLQAGLTTTGTAGSIISCPGTTTAGTLALTAVASAGAFNTVISNRSMGQSTTFSIGDPGASTASLLTSVVNADVGANLITVDITCGQAALASAGSVTLYASSGSKQYKIRNIFLNKVGTNFSGGGGDRLGQVTDGTSVYTVIPAATLQTLTNSVWGSTAVAAPASVNFNTSTVAGASIVFKYSGGTTDYTAGSLTITLLIERVA